MADSEKKKLRLLRMGSFIPLCQDRDKTELMVRIQADVSSLITAKLSRLHSYGEKD